MSESSSYSSRFSMLGRENPKTSMFSYVSLYQRVQKDRLHRALVLRVTRLQSAISGFVGWGVNEMVPG